MITEPAQQTLTSADIQAALDRVTYRPDWKFRFSPDNGWSGSSGYLLARATVEDTYNPGHLIEIVHGTSMPPFWSDDDLLRWVARWLQDTVERHESREWFKVDGRMYDDPHKLKS